MSKRKLKAIRWSMMFKINGNRRYQREYVWEVLHKFDKEKPEAFCEHAYSEDTDEGEEMGDSWYDWHGFLSLKSLESAVPLVFSAFPEVKEIEVFKDMEHGCWADVKLRKKIFREGAV